MARCTSTAPVRPTVSSICSRPGVWLLLETISTMFSSTTTPGKKLMIIPCSGSSARRLFQRRLQYAVADPTSRMAKTSAARQILCRQTSPTGTPASHA